MKHLGKFEFENDEELKDRFGKGKTTTHISLFSGCGGLDIGFAQAGIETRVMIEFDHSCCETLRHNWLWENLKNRRNGHYENKDGTPIGEDGAKIGKVKWVDDELEFKNKEDMKKRLDWYHDNEPVIMERDIKEVTTEEILKTAKLEIGQCSIISGGFPCQGFSLAGKRKVDDPRNALYQEFVRIVNEAKPAMIFSENVPGLVSMQKGETINRICEDFAECGYDIIWDILNAANFGVPQHRKRVILIGKRVDTMMIREDGSVAFHIASQKGKVEHPKLFYTRLKRWKNTELLNKLNESVELNMKPKSENAK